MEESIIELYHTKLSELVPYREITTFSSRPGIYLVGFTDADFPLGDIGPDTVVYIGMTGKSQRSRDANTHFRTRKTGRSTLRRSIGAILKTELKLKALPRGGKSDSRAISHYVFDDDGEQRLTNWMVDKLALAFWEYDSALGSLKDVEIAMIKHRCPVLNWDHNLRKSRELKRLKKICQDEARGKTMGRA